MLTSDRVSCADLSEQKDCISNGARLLLLTQFLEEMHPRPVFNWSSRDTYLGKNLFSLSIFKKKIQAGTSLCHRKIDYSFSEVEITSLFTQVVN
jgi:hypothetical protein